MPCFTWAKLNLILDQPKLIIPSELIQMLNLIQRKWIHWSTLRLKKIVVLGKFKNLMWLRHVKYRIWIKVSSQLSFLAELIQIKSAILNWFRCHTSHETVNSLNSVQLMWSTASVNWAFMVYIGKGFFLGFILGFHKIDWLWQHKQFEIYWLQL